MSVATRKIPAAPSLLETRKKIEALFEAKSDELAYLYARWQDEREYEDFADYSARMAKGMPEGIQFFKATQHPFGFTVLCDGNTYEFRATGRFVQWKRVK